MTSERLVCKFSRTQSAIMWHKAGGRRCSWRKRNINVFSMSHLEEIRENLGGAARTPAYFTISYQPSSELRDRAFQ